jgi:tRNA-uridine 2-sulfurtransferase
MPKRVFVGLSGGVDSAVSAALLKRNGYEVTAVFIKIWRPEFYECTWEKDRIDAMRVAVALGMPFREVDLSDAYEGKVVRDMTESYAAGRTPNPDVECNEKIKFGAFFDWAIAEGADALATGHYARVADAPDGTALMRGIDDDKDQSYFLYRIARAHMSRVMFPVGDMRKADVRRLAIDFSLPVAHKKDSQGLCFVGDVSMADFLARYIDVQEGDVVDTEGKVVGTHGGAALYTIGQRHGFRVLSGSVSLPHYVTRIDPVHNTITVSTDARGCERGSVVLDVPHQLSAWAQGKRYLAQSRYRERPFEVTIRKVTGGWQIDFLQPRIVSPGQSLVLYDGVRCLGGGRIQ